MTQAAFERTMRRGYGSAERPLTRDLLARDSVQDGAAIRETGNFEPDYVNIDYQRYHDPQYARVELEKALMRTWLFSDRRVNFTATTR